MARTRPTPNDAKRKRTSDSGLTAEDDATPRPHKLAKQSDNKTFPFLQLPRELRDEIYRHVIGQGGPTQLKGRDLVTRSGLVGTNNQICEEYMDAVLYYSPVIRTTVKNHNFAHVVTFLNRLSEAQYKKLQAATPYQFDPSHSVPHPSCLQRWPARVVSGVPRQLNASQFSDTAKKRRQIIITLSYSPTKQSTRPHLNRWLDRFDDPNRRGAELDISYEIDRYTWGNGGYKQRPRRRANTSDRWTAEARKIDQASKGVRSGWYHNEFS